MNTIPCTESRVEIRGDRLLIDFGVTLIDQPRRELLLRRALAAIFEEENRLYAMTNDAVHVALKRSKENDATGNSFSTTH